MCRLLISGLQHMLFCPRQWALIFMEQQWEENFLTVQGKLLHEKPDDAFVFEKRKDCVIARAVPVASDALNVCGVCDVVEYHKCNEGGVALPSRKGEWKPVPIEYKRGRQKHDFSDEAQLCAQAMCIEQMNGIEIAYGEIYYAQIRRRVRVAFSNALRETVIKTCETMHSIVRARRVPKAAYEKKCAACSIMNICMPLTYERAVSVYLKEESQ